MEARGEICRHRHGERLDDGAEKRVRLAPVHLARDKADDEAQKAREQAVAQRAAKHRAKARRGAEIAQVINGHRVVPPPLERFVEPLRGDARVRRFGADAARERVELFHRLEVIAVETDALHHHQRLAVGRLEADHHAVGDGKGLAFNAVGSDDAAYRLFDAERLRPAERQMIADARGQIGQKVIIHKKSSYFWEICRQRALYYSETTVLSMLTGRSRKKHLPFCRGGTILVLGQAENRKK